MPLPVFIDVSIGVWFPEETVKRVVHSECYAVKSISELKTKTMIVSEEMPYASPHLFNLQISGVLEFHVNSNELNGGAIPRS